MKNIILKRPLFEDLREKLFHAILFNMPGFNYLFDDLKLSIMILENKNITAIRSSAKTCNDNGIQ